MQLTKRQEQILGLIKSHIQATGRPPTRADIAAEFGFKSANAAEEHLKALARKGAIEMIPGTSRGIRLIDETPPGIPLIGRVAAGSPILATEHVEDYVAVDPSFFKPRADYLLEVVGDSMQDVGIFDGDCLVVHNTAQAENGEIVVARVDDDVTVKRFRTTRSKHIVHLEPENVDYSTIVVDLREQHFKIEGLSVGVIRRQ
ncbi:transcriptional repressor LexA [Pseudomonadales bacterium]|jgi:repressor LexA|nr:transcriptional repressor LexA [bacterium]MDA8965335.1 transcriptional repressor LexA [Pseudomonadales bacterium]MDB4451164.1 transcriptional repressor LexA [Pseudomonadales bacterium]